MHALAMAMATATAAHVLQRLRGRTAGPQRQQDGGPRFSACTGQSARGGRPGLQYLDSRGACTLLLLAHTIWVVTVTGLIWFPRSDEDCLLKSLRKDCVNETHPRIWVVSRLD